jgi:hypothetical protein
MLGRTPIALLAGVFAIALGGCGGSDDGTIPSSDSENLLTMLATLQDQVASQQCTLAEGTAVKISDAVKALPTDVDPDLHAALTKGAENLANLTKDPAKCTPAGATGVGGVETTDESSTTSTDLSTTTTTTAPDETTTPENTDETPPAGPPPGQDEQTPPTGNGQGTQGGGNGGGGGPASGGVGSPGGKR